jgi:eukaryotic-like serine/threonine-protein kinase
MEYPLPTLPRRDEPAPKRNMSFVYRLLALLLLGGYALVERECGTSEGPGVSEVDQRAAEQRSRMVDSFMLRNDREWLRRIEAAREVSPTEDPSHSDPPESHALVTTFAGHEFSVRSVAWSPNGRRIASLGGERTAGSLFPTNIVKLWRIGASEAFRTIRSDGGFSQVAWSPDGASVATSGTDGGLHICDVADSNRVWTLTAGKPGKDISSISWQPGGERLATAGPSGITIWDVAERVVERTLVSRQSVSSIVWSSDGGAIAAWDSDILLHFGWNPSPEVYQGLCRIELWGVSSGSVVRALDHTAPIWAATCSPAGGLLASATSDSAVSVWDLSSGALVRQLAGHDTAAFRCLAWSPDGRTIAGGTKGRIVLWDAATGDHVKSFHAHRRYDLLTRHGMWLEGTRSRVFGYDSSWVNGIAWNPDGDMVASGGVDGMVKLWRVGHLPDHPP